MYLRAEKYVSGYNHGPDPLFQPLVALLGITPTSQAPSATVGINVGYWRKANAVHAWFVDNVQKGEDNCQASHVEPKQLAELRDICKQILQTARPAPTPEDPAAMTVDRELAEELLPTRSGFFFGGTDYDAGYIGDLESTIEIVDRVLDDPKFKDWDFQYSSSW